MKPNKYWKETPTLATINTKIFHPSEGPRTSADRHHHARAFCGDSPLTVDLQARIRFREDNRPGRLDADGIPAARARQLLVSVLSLPGLDEIPERRLCVDVHRPDGGKFHNDYCLAMTVAMVASLTRRSVKQEFLFLGNVGLQNRIEDIDRSRISKLNNVIAAVGEQTPPVTIICSVGDAERTVPSSTFIVTPVRTLADAVAAAWPGQTLRI